MLSYLSSVFAQRVQPRPISQQQARVNYLVNRDLVVDVDAYEHGLIDYPTLIVRREIKWGETQDFD
jgi:hypothetical protein